MDPGASARTFRLRLFCALLFVGWLVGGVCAPAYAHLPAQGPTVTVTVVVGTKGASLHSQPEGDVLTSMVVGTRLTATGRTEDGDWLFVATGDGERGWVESQRMLAWGTERLAAMAAAPSAAPTSSPEMLAPAQPTATPAPVLPATGPTSLALVRMSGATVRSPDGTEITRLAPGERLRASARSLEGSMYAVVVEEGVQGWVLAEDLLVFRADQLPVGMPEQADADTDDTEPAAVRVTVKPIDARLNVRSGPGTDNPIVGKALPGEIFPATGRTATADWIRIRVPGAQENTGWVVAEFVTIDGNADGLPVTE